MSPIYFQDFVASRDQRREAWNRVFNRSAGWTGARPNAGHYAVTRLAEAGKVSVVVTQNVDNLHQDSGMPDDLVIEIHGNASYAKCLDCSAPYDYETLRPRFEADEDLTCETCGGLLKSATISFGHAMPEAEMKLAEMYAQSADSVWCWAPHLLCFQRQTFPSLPDRRKACHRQSRTDRAGHICRSGLQHRDRSFND